MSANGRIDEVLSIVKDLKPVRRITIPAVSPDDTRHPTNIDTSARVTSALSPGCSLTRPIVVVVLTDQPLRDDPRLVMLSPTNPVVNIAITRFALRDRPTTQAMVTIHNDSPLTGGPNCRSIPCISTSISLRRGRSGVISSISRPLRRSAPATLEAADDFDGDNAAYVARQHDLPNIEMRGSLAPEVRRVVEAYQSARPPSDHAATITVVASQDQLKDDQPGIISPLAASRINAAPTAKVHPVTSNLNPTHWTNLRCATPPIGDGWTPILSSDNKPLLSIREHPARQVWIGFTSENLPRTPDFVILWTNALDWLSQTAAAGEFRTFGRPATHFRFSPSNQPAQTKLQSLLKPQASDIDLAALSLCR